MKKPKVFENKIERKINNNQELFNSEKDNVDVFDKSPKRNIEMDEYSVLTVNDKIEKLLNRNGYIFNVDVVIVTKDKEYNTKIAGKVNNHLITLDNDIISITDIKDLIIRN